MDYIKAVRTIRNDMNVHPAKKTSMTIETANPAAFQKGGAYLARFAFATDVDPDRKVHRHHRWRCDRCYPGRPRLYPHDGADRPRKELASACIRSWKRPRKKPICSATS